MRDLFQQKERDMQAIREQLLLCVSFLHNTKQPAGPKLKSLKLKIMAIPRSFLPVKTALPPSLILQEKKCETLQDAVTAAQEEVQAGKAEAQEVATAHLQQFQVFCVCICRTGGAKVTYLLSICMTLTFHYNKDQLFSAPHTFFVLCTGG